MMLRTEKSCMMKSIEQFMHPRVHGLRIIFQALLGNPRRMNVLHLTKSKLQSLDMTNEKSRS